MSFRVFYLFVCLFVFLMEGSEKSCRSCIYWWTIQEAHYMPLLNLVLFSLGKKYLVQIRPNTLCEFVCLFFQCCAQAATFGKERY